MNKIISLTPLGTVSEFGSGTIPYITMARPCRCAETGVFSHSTEHSLIIFSRVTVLQPSD